MRNDCCWYVYEKDTGFSYCRNDRREYDEDLELYDEDDPCVGCKDYYYIEDAKADAKYGDKDKY